LTYVTSNVNSANTIRSTPIIVKFEPKLIAGIRNKKLFMNISNEQPERGKRW